MISEIEAKPLDLRVKCEPDETNSESDDAEDIKPIYKGYKKCIIKQFRNEKDENIDFLDHLRIAGNGGVGNPGAADHLPPRQQLSFALPHGFHHAGKCWFDDHNLIL